jgi:hypothetical protein
MYAKCCSENVMGRDDLVYLGVDLRIILKIPEINSIRG